MEYLDSLLGNALNNSKQKQNYTYTKENSLLKMIAIPSFGVYSPNYSFYIPYNILYQDKLTQNIFNSFPDLMKQHVNDLHNKFKVKFDYFVISLDGSFINSKYKHNTQEGFLRVNFVAHPYIFYDITNLNKDHRTFMLSALYTNLGDSDSHVKEINEDGALKINPEVFLHDFNKKEVILHKSNDNFPALSPNNCALLVNLNSAFFSVFNLIAIFYENKIVKFCVTQFNFVTQNDYLLTHPLINSLNKSSSINNQNVEIVLKDYLYDEHVAKFILNTIFGYFCIKIENLQSEKEIIEMIKFILNFSHLKSKYDNSNLIYGKLNILDYEENYEIIDELRSAGVILEEEIFYQNNSEDANSREDKNFNLPENNYNEFCNFISDFLGRIKIKNFAEKILFCKNLNKEKEYTNTDSNNKCEENFKYKIRNQFIIQVLLKFLRHKINSLDRIIQSYCNYFNEVENTFQFTLEYLCPNFETKLLSERGKYKDINDE